MAKVEKRIVKQVHPNQQIRTWHTTKMMSSVGGICNAVEVRPGAKPEAIEFMGAQATIENSPIAFALLEVISTIPGIKEAKIEQYELRVEIYDAFDFDRDKIADKVTLEIRRHVYSLRQKVQVEDHKSNTSAIHERHNPPPYDDHMMH